MQTVLGELAVEEALCSGNLEEVVCLAGAGVDLNGDEKLVRSRGRQEVGKGRVKGELQPSQFSSVTQSCATL